MRKSATILLTTTVLSVWFTGCNDAKIDFSAQVKPILNKRCISCHGGVKRNAEFSLLFRKEALDTAESGKLAIVPGDPGHSELIRRINSQDPEVRMPYKEEPLTKEEIDILTQWIKEGAEWGDHWAYLPPKSPEIGGNKIQSGFFEHSDGEKRNEIDYFVRKKLEEEKLSPAQPADKATLLRRAYLDIIGLPPTKQQAQKFLKDERPDAYERMVDELLASTKYGEKWASWWLDMARYSDTKGYEKDEGRNIWRYRDWVIRAFNSDMPFDQFTREQLAGDLLPDPSDDQLIATAFHRNTMNNDEGGTDDEEFRVAALIDRVNTTWEIWQSTTLGCVQCHTHPYDPFVHEEYYESMAFFNNTRDEDTPGEHPTLRLYEVDDQEKLQSIKTWALAQGGKEKAKKVNDFLRTLEPKYHPHDFDLFVDGALKDNKWLSIQSGGSARIKNINLDGKSNILFNYWTGRSGGSFEIRLDRLDGDIVGRGSLPKINQAALYPLKPVSGRHDLFFVFRNPSIVSDDEVCNIEWLAFLDILPAGATSDAIKTSFLDLVNAEVETTPIMVENTTDQFRITQVFDRGNWMMKGEPVKPDVPEALNTFPKDQPLNRLGFANWLFSPDNPLTARATVNRFWEQLFGVGIVETLEDFGTQGASPTHQDLLDWLSLRFMNEYRWSMKQLIKAIVMSETYRQDSHITDELKEKDPSNRLLARGPRVRLSAEQVRDQALAVSGLLSAKMYGKSVMPYQPPGVWNSVYSSERWEESPGEDSYRRSVYTYAKRTSGYPAMMMFDASAREVCVSRRIRTNTPLQALVTLNDSSFVVASRNFAAQMMKEGKTPAEQINAGYKRLLIRDMPQKKLDVLYALFQKALKTYGQDKDARVKFTADESGSPQFAAMTVVANAMLNLDEVLTKE
ncbi:MAG TPA: DUF1553 domain-containing protein [Chryseolinea sp.]